MTQSKIVIPENQLNKNPLIIPGQGKLVINQHQPNIFLGLGIATPQKISQKIPFDILGFLLSAEFIKRKIPNSHVFVLIADQHAWLANQLSIDKTKDASRALKQRVLLIISKLNLLNWHLFLASELFPQTKKSTYETLEKRDVIHFVSRHHAGIKLGWTFSLNNQDHKTDEAHFDQLINHKKLRSLFIRPGFTLSRLKPQESPYICTKPSQRILLSKKENVAKKLSCTNNHTCQNTTNAVQKQLKRITILFETLIAPFEPKTPLIEKTQHIINNLFQQ